MDDIPTNTAVAMPIREAVSKDPDPGREAPINTMPEIPSSTVRPTAKGAVTRARLFNSADTTANPPKRKRRTSGKNSLTEARQPWSCPPFGACCNLAGANHGHARRDPTRNFVQYGRLSRHRKRLILASDPLATPWSSSQSTPAMTPPPDRPAVPSEGYWRKNLTYVGLLLFVWFVISYGAGILFVEPLNRIRLPGTGFPLGFWFAQQGSIYVFVVLIFVYVYLMNRLDREFGVDEDAE